MPKEIIRFKFFKKNELKYLSHLDMITLFSRAFIRAGINAEYSSGFNPKPRLSLSNPIPLGIQSLAEYGDLGIAEKSDAQEFKKMVNSQLPLNIQVTEAVSASGKTASLMSVIDLLFYDFEISSECGKDEAGAQSAVKDDLEKKFKEEFRDIIDRQKAGCQLHSYEFTEEEFTKDGFTKDEFTEDEFNENVFAEDAKPKMSPSVFRMKIFGYARMSGELQNKIFKLNEFTSRLKRFLEENAMKINYIQKTEVFIIDKGKLVTPIEIMKQ